MTQRSATLNPPAPRLKTLSYDTPFWLYALHRVLFRATNGYWNDGISRFLKVVNGKYSDIDQTNSIFKFQDQDIKKIVAKIDEDGFCILDQKLPSELVDQLNNFAKKTKVKGVLPTDNYSKTGFQWSEENYPEYFQNKSARCVYEIKDIINEPNIQKVTFDPFFLSIANSYLGVKPILALVYMWWSFCVPNKEQFADVSAQAYHFDMDRLKWLNFFVYLNDVGPENGPHCYVRGSHKRLPKRFLKRGRFTDADVKEHYGDRLVELCGSRGTIMAVDTRGLHKGKLLEKHERLIFQLIFSNSLFGQKYDKVQAHVTDLKIKDYVKKYWHTYFNVF